jgi:hypothetical protein
MTLATDPIRTQVREARSITADTAAASGESRLMSPLIDWLIRSRRVNLETRIAFELPWLGRRVDLATLTTTRRAAAYELKLGGLGRALEQAAYNRLAFDRSYVVTASTPRAENLALAEEHCIGIIVVQHAGVRCLLESPLQPPVPELRQRLLSKFAAIGRVADV